MRIFSNKIFFIIFFSFLILIIITHAENFNNIKIRYDACDPKWANDTLWTNFFAKTSSTICKDVEIKGIKLPKGFISILATAFANKNISCGEGSFCNPSILNRDFIKCGFQLKNDKDKNGTIFDCIGIEIIENKIKLNEINDYIYDGYTIVAGEIRNDTKKEINKFLIEEVHDLFYIRGVDFRGNSVFLHYTVVSDIEIFRIFDTRRNSKNKNKNKDNRDADSDTDFDFDPEGKEDNGKRNKEYLEFTNSSIGYLDEKINNDPVYKAKNEI
jgi:hypothetical protein